MQGVITGKDIVRHLPLILREFGPVCAVRALRAIVTGQRTTFLDVACACKASRDPAAQLPVPPVGPTSYRS